jgi:hypothetical protein
MNDRNTVISSQSNASIVTLTPNVANVPTPIFRSKTPRGALYKLLNQTPIKGVIMDGAYFILDLNDAAGNRISGASKIHFMVKKPSDERSKHLRTLPYSIWRDISSVLQRNEDYKGTLVSQTDLNCGIELPLYEEHEFSVEVEGPTVVDWTKSYIQFNVSEVN